MVHFTGKMNNLRGSLILFIMFFCLLYGNNATAQWVKTSNYSNGTLKSLVFSGSNIFAGGSGVYISRDSCQNWYSLRGPKDKDSNLVTVSSMTVLGNKLFAGTEGGCGVYVSTDNGRSWKILNNGLSNGGSIYNVQSMLTVGNKVYASGFGKIYAISDTGTAWTTGTGLPNADIRAITANSNGVLFAGLNSAGVYRSTDQGVSWVQVNTGLTNTNIRSIYATGTSLYAGTDMGPFLSTNNGDSWTAVNTNFTRTVYAMASIGSNLFAGTGGEIYLSTNSGQSWTSVAGYFTSYQHSVLVVNGSAIYTLDDNGPVLVSSDNGKTWKDKNKGLQLANYKLITSMDGILLAGFNISTDMGATWKPVTIPTGISFYYVATSSAKNFILGTSQGIYVSKDTCKTWTKAATGYNAYAQGIAKLNGKLFSGVDNAIYSSTDDGMTWTVVNAGIKDEFYNKCLIYNMVTAGTQLWIRSSQGMFYSDDEGVTWKVSKVSSTSSNVMSGLGVCKDRPVLSTTSAYPVLISNDKGATWSYASGSIPTSTTVNSFLSVGDSIFASTTTGVYTYSLTAPSWKPLNTGFPFASVPVGNMTQLGQYVYAIRDGAVWGMSLTGNSTLSVNEKKTELNGYSLSQNYPNPFNPSTTISYTIPKQSYVEIKIFDMLGREVSTLVRSVQNAGDYKVQFNAGSLTSGVYIYTIKAGEFSSSKKLMLMK